HEKPRPIVDGIKRLRSGATRSRVLPLFPASRLQPISAIKVRCRRTEAAPSCHRLNKISFRRHMKCAELRKYQSVPVALRLDDEEQLPACQVWPGHWLQLCINAP